MTLGKAVPLSRGAARVQQVVAAPQRGWGKHRASFRPMVRAAVATVSVRASRPVVPHFASHSGHRRWRG